MKINMNFNYEIEDSKLLKMVENKAKDMHMSVNQLIWGYVNRGLMDDELDDEIFEKVHSEKYINEVNNALGLD